MWLKIKVTDLDVWIRGHGAGQRETLGMGIFGSISFISIFLK